MSLNKNNGDKFYRRKPMWATDEKLIINELGPHTGGQALNAEVTTDPLAC